MFIYEFPANSISNANLESHSFFEIKTCQRTIFLSKAELPISDSVRQFAGTDADAFLLRFACGLESEIKGETDVFGQIKTAFKNLLETDPLQASSFQNTFLNLFEDTKEIRAEYLRGIGGNTYGALARRLLSPNETDQVVLLGAGQLSKSVAPYFAEFNLTLFNRSEGRLADLKSELLKKGYSNIQFISAESDLSPPLKTASIVLIATPAGSVLDQKIIDQVSKTAKILHLGGQSHEMAHFTEAGVSILSLSDLFEMEKEQNLFREKQIKQAMDACHSRSILRSMARSIHIPHGWEDLALFY